MGKMELEVLFLTVLEKLFDLNDFLRFIIF